MKPSTADTVITLNLGAYGTPEEKRQALNELESAIRRKRLELKSELAAKPQP